jgi:hypothetical protein
MAHTWAWALIVTVVLPVAAVAQTNGRRVYDEELRLKLDEQIPAITEKGVDGGAWLNIAFFDYEDDAAQKQRTLMRYALRGWASFDIQGIHTGYVRGLLQYDDWHSSDNPTNARGDDFDEEIERAWYQFDLGRMLALQTGERPPIGFRVKVGRQFMTLGTALVLSMPLDAVRFDVDTRLIDTTVFLGKTLHHSRNIDPSDRVAHRQDRCMFGMQATYKGLGQHRPFAYFLNNQDNTNEHPDDPDQSYEYTSRYVGVGSTGPLVLPNLRYQTELVGEWGQTYSNGVTAGRDDICAWAFDAQLSYRFDTAMHPNVMVEYLFGSGDGDRTISDTTIGGNRAGTKDKAFNAFGFRDTGIALAPEVSNLHIYAMGASLFPFENTHELLENMEVGTKIFFYQKARPSGGISDSTATNNARWLGWEWDIFCNWRLTSDLSWTARYGAFRPGSAYDGGDKSVRHFLYTGMVFSF